MNRGGNDHCVWLPVTHERLRSPKTSGALTRRLVLLENLNCLAFSKLPILVLSKLPTILVALSNLSVTAPSKLPTAGALEPPRLPIPAHSSCPPSSWCSRNSIRPRERSPRTRIGSKLTTRSCTVLYQVIALQGQGLTFTHSELVPFSSFRPSIERRM